MDARSLQELWQGPSPFLAQMGKSAFDLAQQKQEADLATTLGLEQRNQAMHPAELAGKTAVTRLNNSTAAMNEDILASNIPAAQRQKQKLQESLSKMDEVSRAQMKAQVTRSAQIANAIKKNNGQIPEWLNLSPEERPYYTPDKLDAHLAFGQAFMEMDPEWLAARKKAQEAERLAKVRADGQIAVKATPGAGGGKNSPTMAPPKMNLEQQMGYYNNLAFAEKDEVKKKAYQAEADRIELMIYRKQIEAAAARRAGDPALDKLGGGIPVNPNPTPTPTPRNNPAVSPSSGSPAQTKMTLTKLQEMYPGVPADKLKEAFKKKFGVDVQ